MFAFLMRVFARPADSQFFHNPQPSPTLKGLVITGFFDRSPVFAFQLSTGKVLRIQAELGTLVVGDPDPLETTWLKTPGGFKIENLIIQKHHGRPCWRFECAAWEGRRVFEVQATLSGRWRIVANRI